MLDDDRPLVAGWAHEGATTSPDVALVRLLSDGTLDTSFGGGRVVTPLVAAGQPDQATALALQVDPRVPTVRAIVVGYATASNVDFAVARYWREYRGSAREVDAQARLIIRSRRVRAPEFGKLISSELGFEAQGESLVITG